MGQRRMESEAGGWRVRQKGVESDIDGGRRVGQRGYEELGGGQKGVESEGGGWRVRQGDGE